jgi:glycolate oxidase FAD binding subunit
VKPTDAPMAKTAMRSQPRTADEVAAALRRAADARQSIVIRGAGTKSGWGRPSGRVDAVLDMRGLNRVLAHQHGDMTATVEAGATLRDVNRTLAQHGQWLPLDPPHADDATIGGILATNDSGPLRHRYGTPRDLVIGVQLATTDGVLAKAGGQVVKNVAGYDLSKLVTGSFGSLAAIVSATFKLAPLPAASKTLTIDLPAGAPLAPIVKAVMSSQLEPMAFELARVGRPFSASAREDRERAAADAPKRLSREGGQGRRGEAEGLALHVLVRFASLPAVVDAQIAQATTMLRACATGATFTVVDGDAEQTSWREHAQRLWTGDGAIVRLSWLPANIDAVIDAVEVRLKPDTTYGADLIGRAAVGAGLARIDGDVDAQVRAIERLRASSVVGNVVVVRGSAELASRVDVWGSHGDRQPLFDALKRTLDPHNVLNAGRGPL